MKIYLFLILFFALTSTIFSQGYWEQIDPITTKSFRTLHFPDSLNGWAAGDSGLIAHTSDSGMNWELQQSNIDLPIVDIFFLDSLKGWALADSTGGINYHSKILSTTDGGITWNNRVFRFTNVLLNVIHYLDSLNGWVGGDGSALAFTDDGGENWYEATIDSGNLSYFPVYDMTFADNKNFGVACGGVQDAAGVIWVTTNSGLNWTPKETIPSSPDPYFAVQIINEDSAIAMGGDLEGLYGVSIATTGDRGKTWYYTELVSIIGAAYTIAYRDSMEVWSTLGFDRKFIYSLDGGITWNDTITPNNVAVRDIYFPSKTDGIAVGDNGTILKYIPKITSINDSKNSILLNGFVLHQNYPNPFNPVTKIKYEISSKVISTEGRNLVQLKVFDILGNSIATLVDEFKPAGSYEVEFNGSELSSGIYFYELKVNTKVLRKKMILLK